MDASNKSLTSIYATNQANQSFTLYEGDMKFLGGSENADVNIQGNGIVRFDWFPSLKAKYDFKCDIYTESAKGFLTSMPSQNRLELCQRELSVKVTALIQGSHGLEKLDELVISGKLDELVAIGASRGIAYLIFNIANFHDYSGEHVHNSSGYWRGRLLLEADGWRVTIDSLEPKIQEELMKSLKDDGGYAITHIAKLERIDAQELVLEEALDVLNGLSYFLAFVRGMWIGPLFPVGFDSGNNCLWEQWTFYQASPYKEVASWFSLQEPKQLMMAFVGFMKRWTDSNWREPLKLAIHWYVESNLQAGAIEGSIIMTQAAFELLYERLLGSPNRKPNGGEKLEKLFKNANLPLNLTAQFYDPSLLGNLGVFATEKNISMPKAITEIRNRITHPQLKNGILEIHPADLRKEVWRVGLWYLELVLLDLFEYQGTYKNRLKFTWEGDYDRSPKTNSSSSR